MADKKISALTSATTPLAGTEVLPIVQSGSTVKVAVSDLTAGRAVSALSLTSTNGATIQGLTVGRGAGAVATNTAVGASALAANTAGDRSVAVGDSALATNSTGILNTAIGYQAAQLNSISNDITAVGFTALKRVTASQNTAVGSRCAPFLTSGQFNVGLGDFVLSVANTSSSNTAIGSQTLSSTTTAGNSTAVGASAGNLSTGIGNQFFGYSSGSAVTTGAKNVILGSYTGSAAPISATGSNNIVLSDGDGVVRQTINSSGQVGIGTTSPAETLHLKDTRAILRLEPTAVGGTTFNIRNGVSGVGEGGLSFYDVTAAATRAVIDSSGNVGIGVTAPLDKLSVSAAGAAGVGGVISVCNSSATAVGNESVIGFRSSSSFGTTFYSGKIRSVIVDSATNYSDLAFNIYNGSSSIERMRVNYLGIVTMNAYGAGAATFSAAGVISSVSDETWKIKDGVPTDPDAMLKKLEPGYWYYNDEKKETFGSDRQLGFYAQNVNAAIGPEAAPTPEEGKPWGYYDRSVLAVTVMSLQKALATIESLTARIAALETQ